MKPLFFVIAMIALLSGCGPKLTPVLPHHAFETDAHVNKADVAKVGESVLSGRVTYALAGFSPRWETGVATPDGMTMTLLPDQMWTASYVLCDGSLVVEPAVLSGASGVRYGLRIDERGFVVGNRPWFDLTHKNRPSQPGWGAASRLLFRQNGMHPLDVFVFDLGYVGKDGAKGVFDLTEFKHTGVRKSDAERFLLDEREEVTLYGLDVRIVRLYDDHVRFVVEEADK